MKMIVFRSCESIILKVGGGPERPLVRHFVHNVFQRAFRNICFAFFIEWAPKGVPKGGPTKDPQTTVVYFFYPVSLGSSWGAVGRQNTPQDHQNDSQIDPGSRKTRSPKDPQVSLIALGINRTTGRSTQAQRREGRRQVDIYIHIYIYPYT